MHPQFGDLAMQNVAPKLSSTPGAVRTAGPELGEHNAAVFADILGMDEATLTDLAERGIVGKSKPMAA